MKKLLTFFVGISAIFFSSCSNGSKTNVEKNLEDSLGVPVVKTKVEAFATRKNFGELTVFVPTCKSIDLVCGKRPNVGDSSVIYCAEAAFTGECLDSFRHFNIAGNHVSGGFYYKGYKAKANTGAFVWYQGKWKFVYGNYAKELKVAASHGGMGFGQNMVIYQGCALPRFRKDKPQNIYRALCEWEGKLCIVESRHELAYSEFVALLQKLKAKNALYLDMGPGWNYSWYRDSIGMVHEIHPRKPWSKYQTNWIVFKE